MIKRKNQDLNSDPAIKPAKAIRVLALIFIARGLYSFLGNLNFDYYHFMFQQLPDHWIKIRYFCTLAIRVAEITLGVGLWVKNEMFRKAAICLCLLSLVLIYWKHPFFVFHNIAVRAEYGAWDTSAASYTLKHPQFPVISMIFYYAVDIIFYLAAVFYLLNPRVRKEFQRKR